MLEHIFKLCASTFDIVLTDNFVFLCSFFWHSFCETTLGEMLSSTEVVGDVLRLGVASSVLTDGDLEKAMKYAEVFKYALLPPA